MYHFYTHLLAETHLALDQTASGIQQGFSPRVMIRNAELNYQISEKLFCGYSINSYPIQWGTTPILDLTRIDHTECGTR